MFHAFDLRQGGLLEKIPGHATSLSLPALFPPAASGVPLGGQDWRLAMAREAIDAANLMNKSEQPVSSSTDLDMSIGAAALMELAQGAGRASEKQEPKVECPPKEDIPAPGPSELVRGANTAGVQAHDTRTRRPVPAPAPTTTVAHRATKGGGGRTGPQPAGQTTPAAEGGGGRRPREGRRRRHRRGARVALPPPPGGRLAQARAERDHDQEAVPQARDPHLALQVSLPRPP
eukprot:CAMPEP_0169476790 /NCGR_PEP_ID=MMETSP1042-20121227/27564_1 /TAXON_ID=464988 /ORGANISM="Hemiselmis andersenii, Strain CCMP1180" /LENGTH=231 /DNA_ID=CAMNT_0009591083 /DNA_START=136 /DNA_END=828 /DNA_ORIENTATION=+